MRQGFSRVFPIGFGIEGRQREEVGAHDGGHVGGRHLVGRLVVDDVLQESKQQAQSVVIGFR